MNRPSPKGELLRRQPIGIAMIRRLALICLLSAPTGYLAWKGCDMPQLGYFGDDTIYLVTAKSLATGSGYRILNLPGAPIQTKYPPLYPLLLSSLWKISPTFPANLPLMAFSSWLMVPLLLILSWRTFVEMGLSAIHAGILCGLLSVSWSTLWFGVNLMPELLFTSLVLATTLLADSKRHWLLTVAAGLLAGITFLVKAAALPLLLTSPLLYALKRRYSSAGLFIGCMLPSVMGWMWWATTHRVPSADRTWTYYTDYLGYQMLNVHLSDYPLVLTTNLVILCRSCGELLSVPGLHGWLGYLPPYLAAALALCGTFLLATRKGITHYMAFAPGLVMLLLPWHYPPQPRFLVPLLPLLVAGMSYSLFEGARLITTERARLIRMMAWSAVLAFAMFLPLIATTYIAAFSAIARNIDSERERRASIQPFYTWVRCNTSLDSLFMANKDGVLYLYTGRPAIRFRITPISFYREDVGGITSQWGEIYRFATLNNVQYFLSTESDFIQDDYSECARTAVSSVLADSTRFRLMQRTNGFSVYEVANASGKHTRGVFEQPSGSRSFSNTEQHDNNGM
jgi:hypothetical protein